MGCLGTDTLLDVVEGRADAAMAARVAEHASRCSACREVLSSLARDTDLANAPTVSGVSGGSVDTEPGAPAEGASIGRYVVRVRVGAGGMGVVYAAHDPELDRRVAIKLLRPGLGSPEEHRALEERLRREAQALAQIAHPNVVAVHDVGRHGERIYIAMELVEGETLRLWWARPRTTAALLAVFVAAGRGLAAAHAVGLVHRDFKPDNVLVGTPGVGVGNADARVRVVDFGLARTTGVRGDHGVLALTVDGAVMGTPYYMAPEQRRGEEADARSDQYAFCVALDEALGSRRVPARVRRAIARGRAEAPGDRFPSMAPLLAAIEPRPRVARWVALGGAAAATAAVAVTLAVATGAPEPPCRGAERRLAGVWDAPRKAAIAAALRATGAPFVEATLAEVMRVGDDRATRWIAMHTEACTATRIDGAQTEAVLGLRMACLDDRRRALAAFGDRMLEADREVAAAAVRAVYRIGDVEACADVATLSAPVPPPADAETRARVDALRVELAAVKSQRDLGLYKPGLAAARALTPRAVELGYRPLEADVRVIEGILASDLGEFADAERSLEAALWAAEASRHDVAAADALIELIWVVGERRSRPDDAERLEARATATLERLGRPAELGADLDVATASIALDAGKLEDAEVDLRHALELLERKFGPDDLRLTDALRGLGIIELQRRRGALADAFFQRALAIRGRVLSPDHPSVGQIYEGIGAAQYALDQLDEAAASYDRALAIFERAYGPENWQVANVLHNRAQVDTWRGKEALALDMLRRVVAIDERVLGPDHTSTIEHRDTLALTYEQVGRNDEAKTELAKNLTALRELPEQPRLSSSLHTLARIELARRDLYAAAAAATEARAMIERLRGPDAANYGLLRTIGEIDLARGRPAEAIAPLELAMARLDQTENELEEALTRGLYGRALYDAGTDRKRGVALVRDAYRVLAADSRVDELAAELRDWLRQRRLL